MSQQKVDYHKEQKRNRRKIMKKERAMRRLEITLLIVILAALIGWFSYLVYRNVQAKYAAANIETTEMHLAGWENYTQNLDALIHGEDIEEVTEGEAETEDAAAEAGTEVTEGEAETEDAAAETEAQDTAAGEAEKTAEDTETEAVSAGSEESASTSEEAADTAEETKE